MPVERRGTAVRLTVTKSDWKILGTPWFSSLVLCFNGGPRPHSFDRYTRRNASSLFDRRKTKNEKRKKKSENEKRLVPDRYAVAIHGTMWARRDVPCSAAHPRRCHCRRERIEAVVYKQWKTSYQRDASSCFPTGQTVQCPNFRLLISTYLSPNSLKRPHRPDTKILSIPRPDAPDDDTSSAGF